MKRLVCTILCLVLLLPLCACGPRQASAKQAAPPETPTLRAPGFCVRREYSRVYVQPFDGGEAWLLADRQAVAWVRRGTKALISFVDGSVEAFDLQTGESRLMMKLDYPVYELHWADSGIFWAHTTMQSADAFFLNTETGETWSLEEYMPSVWGFEVIGDELFFIKYAQEKQADELVSVDLVQRKENWRADGAGILNTFVLNGQLFVKLRGTSALMRIDTRTGAQEEVPLPFDPGKRSVVSIGEKGYLVEGDYTERWALRRVTEQGILQDLELQPGAHTGGLVEDQEGSLVYISTSPEGHFQNTDGEEETVFLSRGYILNVDTGELTEVTARGENQKRFAAGDFPLMDSSTARKPVTAAIYRLFCAEADIPGAVPLCSTTHNAWLNIADRKADIALLAAPTEEEKQYLKEQGTEVEMKLYGGDGLVFIGNKSCGVQNLTLDELRGIFRGEITNWSQLGGTDHAIRVLYRDDQSGSQRLMKSILWKGEEMPDFEALGFERLDEMSTIVLACTSDPYAIGYSIMTYLRDVFSEESLQLFTLEGAEASPEHVKDGSYPLGTKGYVVIRADEPEGSPARRLFDWFGTPTADDLLTSCGVTPLHE